VSSETPLVSICVPAYNAERWIAAALESALAQTYAEFELVVADNGSTDATREIAQAFADPRLRIETARQTISAVANHNRAVRLSRGVFVKFLHADDLLLPECVEEMVGLALEDDRIGLVFAPREVLLEGAPDPEWAEAFARPHERFQDLDQINDGRRLFRQLLAAGFFEDNWIGEPSAVLLRRRTLERVGLFNERLFQIADLELWARIAYDHRLGFVDRTLSVYRHHELSGTAQNARIGRDWFDWMWFFEGLLAIPDLTPEDRNELRRLRRATLRRALRAQAGRILHRRWTLELPSYVAYRLRSGFGGRPRLYETLEEVEAAEAHRLSPAGR
jgi:glycosyltransferase involved in cell wall biosynthesis